MLTVFSGASLSPAGMGAPGGGGGARIGRSVDDRCNQSNVPPGLVWQPCHNYAKAPCSDMSSCGGSDFEATVFSGTSLSPEIKLGWRGGGGGGASKN